MSYVYIAPLKDKTAFKIGKATDPKIRIISLSKFYEFDYNEINLIKCNSIDESYKIESILHDICKNQNVILQYDGGTEFFDYKIYSKIMDLIKHIVELYNITIEVFNNDIKKTDVVKHNEIELLLTTLSSKIKFKRLEYNLTQEELSKLTGITKPTIRKMETGGNVEIMSFIKILKALDLDEILSSFETVATKRVRARSGNLS